MKNYFLICLFIILVSVVGLHARVSDTRSFDSVDSMRHPDGFYRHELIHETVRSMSIVDSWIELVGFILFGPRKGLSTLRAVRDGKSPFGDDFRCLSSTVDLFKKHCGFYVYDLKHTQALSNLCRYVVYKAAIEDAIRVACGMDNFKPAVIDLGHPVVYATPAPLRGFSSYCDRVSVRGISGLNLESYGKAYQVSLVPSSVIPLKWHKKIQICFHRNASLGWCRCEKDDWISLHNGSWDTFMSPYEQRFIDVNFDNGVYGFVRITLEEVSQKWRYVLLLVGITLVFMSQAVSRYTFISKWGVRVFGVSFVFLSSIDTVMATTAVVLVCICYFSIHEFISF